MVNAVHCAVATRKTQTVSSLDEENLARGKGGRTRAK